jgi:hypothetical protein
MQHQQTYQRAKQEARHTARQHSTTIERLGRLGFASYGTVYVLVGVLAAMAALGRGGDTTDTHGALNWIVEAPYGRLLLAAITVGLLGYALWRLIQASLDTEGQGAEAKGMLARAGYVISGAVYAGLALSAARLAVGGGTTSTSDEHMHDWSARLLAQPWGAALIGLGGLGLIGYGLYQLYRAARPNFRKQLRLDEMSPDQQRWVERLVRLGCGARGIVFGIIGGFLLVTARSTQPDEARGLGGALATLAEQPHGPWLLGIVAVGLIAYGIFNLAQARYRRMQVS